MHQAHNIPWHLLALNIKYVHNNNKVTPPFSGLMLKGRPTQTGELNHFTRKMISAIHTFALTERAKYPPAQKLQTPPQDRLVFSAELLAKYPQYLSEENQKLNNWFRLPNSEPNLRWKCTPYDLADVVKILLVENQMDTLLMLANHPSFNLRILDSFGGQVSHGIETTIEGVLSAYLLWNFMDAAGHLSSGMYKNTKTMKELVGRQKRLFNYSPPGIPHQDFLGQFINTDPPTFDSEGREECRVPEVRDMEGAEKLQAYLKHLFEVLYRYEMLMTECGLDRGADWENKIVAHTFGPLGIEWPGSGVIARSYCHLYM